MTVSVHLAVMELFFTSSVYDRHCKNRAKEGEAEEAPIEDASPALCPKNLFLFFFLLRCLVALFSDALLDLVEVLLPGEVILFTPLS